MNTSRLRADEYRDGILKGNRLYLAKAVTLVESTLPADQAIAGELLDMILPEAGKSLRIGITGPPGVGKSTFIEAFGKMIVDAGKKVAVLTIDPSSQVTGGSILGDKTRMDTLARSPHAFIRPSPSGYALGGVTAHTRESILLCEAAGFDIVIVETVGTGQSEISVKSMVDFFLLLIQPGSGDELQGIKKGIVEMADAIVVTKADGDNVSAARATQAEYQHALHLLKASSSGWQPRVTLCSSISGSGLSEIFDTILAYRDQLTASGHFEHNRRNQYEAWFRDRFQQLLSSDHMGYNDVVAARKKLELDVRSGSISPRRAAQSLLEAYHDAIRGKT